MTGQSQHNWPDSFVKERFLRSWANNLMVFKKSGLGLGLGLTALGFGLQKTGGLGLVT